MWMSLVPTEPVLSDQAERGRGFRLRKVVVSTMRDFRREAGRRVSAVARRRRQNYVCKTGYAVMADRILPSCTRGRPPEARLVDRAALIRRHYRHVPS